MASVNHGNLTSHVQYGTVQLMKQADKIPDKPQLGVRIDPELVVEAKVLAARQKRRLNDVVEEALKDLLKKYKGKA